MITTRQQTRNELRAADGTCINYSVTEHMLANGYADRFPGATVVTITEDRPLAPYEQVLVNSGIPEEHWPLLRADMTRQRNMARDAGRPSDAMRSAVRAFQAGRLTEESFAAARPTGHYPEDAS